MKSSRSLCLLAAAGCLSLAGTARADIRLEEKVRGQGVELRRQTLLRADRRRIELEPAGGKTGEVEGVPVQARVEITRLDRGAAWTLDPATKQYDELSFEEIRQMLQVSAGERPAGVRQPLREIYRAGE